MRAGSSVASPGCRRFRSRGARTATVTPRVDLERVQVRRRTHARTRGSGWTFGSLSPRPAVSDSAAPIRLAVLCSSNPGAYGWAQTSRGSRATLAGPRCAIASWINAYVTESTPVPMWVTRRPGQTDWISTFVAPARTELGCGPVVGRTVASVDDRTVVQAVGPGVSSRPRRLIAVRRCEPAACWKLAAVQPARLHSATLPTV